MFWSWALQPNLNRNKFNQVYNQASLFIYLFFSPWQRRRRRCRPVLFPLQSAAVTTTSQQLHRSPVKPACHWISVRKRVGLHRSETSFRMIRQPASSALPRFCMLYVNWACRVFWPCQLLCQGIIMALGGCVLAWQHISRRACWLTSSISMRCNFHPEVTHPSLYMVANHSWRCCVILNLSARAGGFHRPLLHLQALCLLLWQCWMCVSVDPLGFDIFAF